MESVKKKSINEEVQINTIISEAWTTYFQNLYQSNNEQPETNKDSNRTMMKNEYYDVSL